MAPVQRTITMFFILLVFNAVPFTLMGQESGAGNTQGRNVAVEMRNVMYHYTGDAAVHIRTLRGELVPVAGKQFPVFDDKNSFVLKISAAEIAITPASMANVLNSHVLNRRDTPIKDVSIQIVNNKLKIKGKLHSKGDVGFETDSVISATPEGKIRLHTEKVRALHLPVKGLMDLFGIELADLIKNGKIQGIQTEKDDLILDPQQVLPPPHIEGKISDVRLMGGNIVQFFGSREAAQPKTRLNGNFMAYQGNRLQFGKLLMSDTDMILIDMDSKDPFDFLLDRYKDQLSAGYVKLTPSMGLRVFMRDFNKLGKKAK